MKKFGSLYGKFQDTNPRLTDLLKQLFEMANINFNSLDPTQKKEIQKWADSKKNQSRIKHFGASIRQQTEHKKPPSSSMAQSQIRRPKQTQGKYAISSNY